MSRITPGWLAHHTPQGPGGRHAALIDVAQDLLLAHLHEQATFEHLVFKGGTALRKLYAGNAGRFSTDLDFSVRDPADDPAAVSDLLRGEIDGLEIDGFHYRVDDHRGRPQVAYDTPFGGVGGRFLSKGTSWCWSPRLGIVIAVALSVLRPYLEQTLRGL